MLDLAPIVLGASATNGAVGLLEAVAAGFRGVGIDLWRIGTDLHRFDPEMLGELMIWERDRGVRTRRCA